MTDKALIRKRSDTELMPPPPPAKRIARPKHVLDEDTYTEALSHIIARDFFPGLLEIETQKEYLDALESKDEEWIESAARRLKSVMTPGRRRDLLATPLRNGLQGAAGRTPVGFVGDTPASMASNATAATAAKPAVDTSLSLAAFQAKYTSEDNESFYKLLDKQNQKKAEKYAWLWTGNKLPSKQQLKQKEVEAKLLAQRGSLVDDGFKRDRLAIRDSADVPDRPAAPDTWKIDNPRNQLMFVPDGIEERGLQTVAERQAAESRAPPKKIVYANTRAPLPPTATIKDANSGSTSDNRSTRAGSPSLSEIRLAIAGHRRPCDAESSIAPSTTAGGETPRVNGYAFVSDRSPSPEPRASKKKKKDPLPEIELGPGDPTPNPFSLQPVRKREELHHRMVEKIAASRREASRLGVTGKVSGVGTPATVRSMTPGGRMAAGNLTPAAQRLLGKVVGSTFGGGVSPFSERVVATPRTVKRAGGSKK
ncbi:uncharacterized protein CTHT_0067690 [Thermochaetoides thermophila DSM 1495]|uniref:Uncharacterized protein n=1 Tax=Chaetomium thermophilum (strain DSM 1495 / CBS 144.50 / IMI 039719) TaxID=759272 RepID=G0SGV3_CHATD|nr:hypothetical protein CTHT_0067690 [Thermochaetoides thermophila DSM 1495]EGS17442.1 hypothetical protein CTHT_0067690 [Thermochaetoides thermophila DSM 1495]